MNQICVFCEHWYIEYDGPYSALTPGEGFTSGCFKRHWEVDGRKLSVKEYRANICKGLVCPDFQKAKDLKK